MENGKKNRSIELEGSTTKETIKKALQEFGVKRNQLEITVLCEEERGLFGLKGAKPAKIRATLKENADK